MAFDPRSIDEMPLFKLATDIVMSAPGTIARGLGRLTEGLSSIAGSVSEGRSESGMFASLKESILGSREASAQERAVERSPSMEIAAPAASLGKYEVAMSDLGGFSAPTFGSGSQSQGAGVRVG